MRERKSSVDNIKLTAIWIPSSVSSKWKSREIQNGRQKKLCGLHNSTSHSNQKCFQQKSGSKCKDISTVVDSRNGEEHETCVVVDRHHNR